MYEWHHVHYLDELRRAGHTISYCNPVKVLGRIGSAEEYSHVLYLAVQELLKYPGPYLLLSNATDETLVPDAIDRIRRLGVPCVNLSVDDLTVPFNVRQIGSHFDLCWTTFLEAEGQLKKYGCQVIYMPMAANPFFFKPEFRKREHALCFVGSRYGARNIYIERLARESIPMRIRGLGWENAQDNNIHLRTGRNPYQVKDTLKQVMGFAQFPAGRKILAGALKKRLFHNLLLNSFPNYSTVDIAGPLPTFKDMVDFYSRWTTSLGILETGSTYVLSKPLVHYRLREFEAPMLGCAHIVHRVPDLVESFEENKEMIFYSSLDECIEKARFYLTPKRESICRTIGEKARIRAMRDHSWLNRFTELTKRLGIKM